MQAYRVQLGAMMARLAARGFRGLHTRIYHRNASPRRDRRALDCLGSATGVTKQAMSQLIRLLEERDYVEQVPECNGARGRRSDPTDETRCGHKESLRGKCVRNSTEPADASPRQERRLAKLQAI